MDRVILANFLYIFILIFMVASALWVLVDCRKKGRPWGETVAWALLVGGFFGLGLVVYKYWNRKFNK